MTRCLRPACLTVLIAAIASCGGPDVQHDATDATQQRAGCAPADHEIRDRLARAGETPWCGRRDTPREAYRFIWGYADRPLVVSVRAEGDSAVVHGFAARLEHEGKVYPAIDTTYAMGPSKFEHIIRKQSFRNALWHVAQPATPSPPHHPPIWVLEAVRDGEYHASVRWGVYAFDLFSSAANVMSGLLELRDRINVGRNEGPQQWLDSVRAAQDAQWAETMKFMEEENRRVVERNR